MRLSFDHKMNTILATKYFVSFKQLNCKKFKEYFKINKNYLGDYLQRINGKFSGLNNLRNIRNGDNNNNINI